MKNKIKQIVFMAYNLRTEDGHVRPTSSLEEWFEEEYEKRFPAVNEPEITDEEIGGVSISKLTEILKGESVYRLLRYGVKSPSSSGMDDCDDDCYYDLYNLVCKLRDDK